MNAVRTDRRARRRSAAAIVALAATLLALLALTSPAPAPADTLRGLTKPLYAFGLNEYGELGSASGVSTQLPQPNPVAALLPHPSGTPFPTVAAAATGTYHSLALTTDGTLYAFGNNWYGQLGSTTGNGTNTPEATPTAITLPAGAGAITAIAAGAEHSLVVTATGQLYAFGENNAGQLGTTANTSANPVPTAVGLPLLPPQRIVRVQKVTAVAAGGNSSYALTSLGSLYAFGDNYDGQLGIVGATTYPAPTAVTLPGESGTITQIEAGAADAFAITSSGQLYAFGDNHFGELGISGTEKTATPTLVTLPGQDGAITGVAAGGEHTLVMTASGQLYSFGSNQYGQLGSETNVGTTSPNPTPALVNFPPGAGPVRQISAAGSASYAVTSSGTLYTFGTNYYGQLGNAVNAGSANADPDPVAVSMPNGERVETLARGASAQHMLAITSNLAVTTTTLPGVRVGTAYDQTVAATGGVAPYSWSATGLPHGLAISAAGEITGTPTAAGTASVVTTVTDADGIATSSAPTALTITAKSSTTTTSGAPTGSNPPSSESLGARLRSQLGPHISITKLLKTGRYRLTLRGLGSAKIAIRWMHRSSPHARTVLVASGKAHLTATALVVSIELTARGRRLLAHAKHFGLTIAATLTPAGSAAVNATRPATLSRKGTR
jgi:alpha-tubulin suppressor-like RCC1 family protein